MKRSGVHLLVVLFCLAVAGVIPTPASAKIKPKNGVYLQVVGKQNGYVIVERGRITGAVATMRFRNSAGKPCAPKGLFAEDGLASVSFNPKSPAGTNRKNAFSFTGAKSSIFPALRTSASGRFISANLASLTIKAGDGKCSGTLALKKARYSPGG